MKPKIIIAIIIVCIAILIFIFSNEVWKKAADKNPVPDIFKNTGLLTKTNEYAFKYKAAIDIINYLKDNDYKILGGDVLNENFEYTYDNWYFNLDSNMTSEQNVTKGYEKAKEYIEWYHNQFGDGFYYIIVYTK